MPFIFAHKKTSFKIILLIVLSFTILIINSEIFLSGDLELESPDSNNDLKEEDEPIIFGGVRLCITDTPNESVSIMYFSEIDVGDSNVVYSTNEELDNSTLEDKEAESEVKYVFGTYIYTVRLESLEPDTQYYYQVRGITYNRSIMSFKTFSSNISELKIVVISDSQRGENGYEENIRTIFKEISTIEFDFFIHCGDIVGNGRNQKQWNRYFVEFEEIGCKYVGFYVEGNHDGGESLLMYENIPMESSYSYKFNDLFLFLGLNTQNDTLSRLSSEEFIAKNLNQTSTWKVVAMHKPIYQTYSIRGYGFNRNWLPYFHNNSVDMCFWGHSHFYEHLYDNIVHYFCVQPVGGNPNGEKYYTPCEYSLVHEHVRGYMLLSLNRECLNLKAFGLDKDDYDIYLIDEVEIEK